MRDAERALTVAIGNAKDAKTLVEACSGLDGLAKQLDALEHVTPPVGFERPFSEGRNGMGMTLGMMRDQDCAADSGTGRRGPLRARSPRLRSTRAD